MTELKKGDRVRLKPHPLWNQPYRGWAERGRLATVVSIFVAHGSTIPMAAVKFDRQRTDRNEIFHADDLLIEVQHD